MPAGAAAPAGAARASAVTMPPVTGGGPLTIDSPRLYEGPLVRVVSLHCPVCHHYALALQPRGERTPLPCVVPVRWIRWTDKTCPCGAPQLIEMEAV